MSHVAGNGSPFGLRLPASVNGLGRWRALAERFEAPIGRLLGLPQMNAIYRRVTARAHDPRPFLDRVIDEMRLRWRVEPEGLARIPTSGPCVVVANHPCGVVDGLVLLALLRRVRPDARVLANHVLGAIPELADSTFCVDPFGGDGARDRNVAPMRTALRWVERGGLLGVFPAGEVAHLVWEERAIAEPRWSPSIARLIRKVGARVVPIFFEGRNSALFQVAGLLHRRLRTAMLPRELLNKQRSTVRVRVGSPVEPERLRAFDDDRELITSLRLRSLVLGRRPWRGRRAPIASAPLDVAPSAQAPTPGAQSLVRGASPAQMTVEIGRLPASQRLLVQGEQEVWWAEADQVPSVMWEIGCLREAAFRAAGAGTGKSVDLDAFDERYLHLFVWSPRAQQVVAGCRLGPTDRIVPRWGKDGLYTSQLYDYPLAFVEHLDPAIELGRSFVRLDRQRSYAALLLLWKGLAAYMVRHPRYHRFFGAVTIGNDYHPLSRQLMIQALAARFGARGLPGPVVPRQAPPLDSLRDLAPDGLRAMVDTADDLSALVGEIEPDGRGVPVLLRKYLRLGARVVGFNVDPDFSDTLDALMVADLMDADEAVLRRYMGAAGLAAFRAHHGVGPVVRRSAAPAAAVAAPHHLAPVAGRSPAISPVQPARGR